LKIAYFIRFEKSYFIFTGSMTSIVIDDEKVGVVIAGGTQVGNKRNSLKYDIISFNNAV
jgi:hypothetical protein